MNFVDSAFQKDNHDYRRLGDAQISNAIPHAGFLKRSFLLNNPEDKSFHSTLTLIKSSLRIRRDKTQSISTR